MTTSSFLAIGVNPAAPCLYCGRAPYKIRVHDPSLEELSKVHLEIRKCVKILWRARRLSLVVSSHLDMRAGQCLDSVTLRSEKTPFRCRTGYFRHSCSEKVPRSVLQECSVLQNRKQIRVRTGHYTSGCETAKGISLYSSYFSRRLHRQAQALQDPKARSPRSCIFAIRLTTMNILP